MPAPPPSLRSWPALKAARAHDPRSCVAFFVAGRRVGSVDRRHLPALGRQAGLALRDDGVHLLAGLADASAALAGLNGRLRDDGLLRGWRNEVFPLLTDAGDTLATIERASARFWGLLTRAAHCNGAVLDAQGRPQALWIGRRALNKSTDPGRLDNLVGGGVPLGQTPFEALVREGWEEAGLPAATMAQARPGAVLHLLHDCAHGLMREELHAHDLVLPAGVQPVNQDGEVAEFRLLPIADALALAASDEMTVDAALVTLDFARRHGLLPAADQPALAAAMQALMAPPP